MVLIPDEPDIPWYQTVLLLLTYLIVGFFSYLSEIYDRVRGVTGFAPKPGYAPLFKGWESFWTRKLYKRISDCYNRPVVSCPSDRIVLRERTTPDMCETLITTDNEIKCLNLGSYNYLGFSATEGRTIEEAVAAIQEFGVSTTSPRVDLGTHKLHRQLEVEFAKFLGKEECIIFGMGYGTNSSTVPAIVGPGCLVISDSLNHSSIVHGCRISGAKVRTFAHNDTNDLERVVRDSIIKGQPRTHRPWKKILIIVEGIYSMEGEVCKLPAVVAIKNKYKCYLWVDEAHSIGALGEKGGGICQHFGIDTKEVDVLMGTFTKSFASVGGYITGTKELISHIRKHNFSALYSTSMSPGCCQQSLTSLNIISGQDGTNLGAQKLKALKDNSNFFRNGLIDLGFQVYGDKDSPVIPMMLYFPAKMAFFSRECLQRGLATVIVGFPAVPLLLSRARFCISASHKKEDLEQALRDLDEIGDKLLLKYGSSVDLHR
eukprot:TRINITY_DN16700_c0_g1_i1.p1 TRINITY_DN16700_c0_g1~~TRINITY_DN16700_c0_g1_i1.p1  ORF type:complete len:486 (+),score=88.35 TRINITY_DN16700_c0_g1_i1:62-1519(+)